MIDAALGEIITTCSKLEWLINYGEGALKPQKRRSNLALSYKTSRVYYEPLGVVAAIISWNYREPNCPAIFPAGITELQSSVAQSDWTACRVRVRWEWLRCQVLGVCLLVISVLCRCLQGMFIRMWMEP